MLLSNTGVFGALSWILDSDQLRDRPEVVATTRGATSGLREDVPRGHVRRCACLWEVAAFRKLTAEADTCGLMISS